MPFSQFERRDWEAMTPCVLFWLLRDRHLHFAARCVSLSWFYDAIESLQHPPELDLHILQEPDTRCLFRAYCTPYTRAGSS